jgi:6-phosphogluconolactonase
MSSQYPNSPDLLLLSLGEDGHIASLFPGTKEINKKTNIDLILKKKGHNRLTITPKVIEASKNKIVFVQGMKKIDKFNEILSSNKNILAYPAHLLEDASWFLID